MLQCRMASHNDSTRVAAGAFGRGISYVCRLWGWGCIRLQLAGAKHAGIASALFCTQSDPTPRLSSAGSRRWRLLLMKRRMTIGTYHWQVS